VPDAGPSGIDRQPPAGLADAARAARGGIYQQAYQYADPGEAG
jgi:hypothetical protein